MLSGNILITGGTGSIGGAIIRTAQTEQWPCGFTIYSRNEFQQATAKAKYPHCRYLIGDIRDYDHLSAAIAGHDLVIHAAAMKHVDLGDQQPAECFAINCSGSLNVVRACIANGVKRCVAISTDKVARCVTAYGASKLIMEKLFLTAPHAPTAFTIARYGNVIASNGSVVTVWRDMLARNGYVSATDPDMTRFWLTTAQAVKLIELAADEPAGTVAIPRLPSLSMRDMARYTLPEAEFRYTGLRTNEKRHEDLLAPEEARSVELCDDPRAPWGYYRLHTAPVANADPDLCGYRSDAPAQYLSKDAFLELLG